MACLGSPTQRVPGWPSGPRNVTLFMKRRTWRVLQTAGPTRTEKVRE
jgi:hypothetical protein